MTVKSVKEQMEPGRADIPMVMMQTADKFSVPYMAKQEKKFLKKSVKYLCRNKQVHI